MNEQEKFLKWHSKEVGRGLVDLSFFAGDGCSTKISNSEDFLEKLTP